MGMIVQTPAQAFWVKGKTNAMKLTKSKNLLMLQVIQNITRDILKCNSHPDLYAVLQQDYTGRLPDNSYKTRQYLAVIFKVDDIIISPCRQSLAAVFTIPGLSVAN